MSNEITIQDEPIMDVRDFLGKYLYMIPKRHLINIKFYRSRYSNFRLVSVEDYLEGEYPMPISRRVKASFMFEREGENGEYLIEFDSYLELD